MCLCINRARTLRKSRLISSQGLHLHADTECMAHLQIVPAGSKRVEAQFVEMKVPLYSFGCEKKVKKALSHLRGIHSVHVDYELQKVTVWGICNKDDVLATIKKKRREARFWDQSEEKVEEEDGEIHDVSLHLPATKSFKFKRSWKKLFPLLLP